MARPFAHLHLHTEYSVLDGFSQISPLCSRAAELEMPALAITDHGVMYGAIDFYNGCKRVGVKPIVGVETYVALEKHTRRSPEDKKQYHLVLLARTTAGYRNLVYLVTKAHLDGFYYKPRIDKELLAAHSQGLICLSACASGVRPARRSTGDIHPHGPGQRPKPCSARKAMVIPPFSPRPSVTRDYSLCHAYPIPPQRRSFSAPEIPARDLSIFAI